MEDILIASTFLKLWRFPGSNTIKDDTELSGNPQKGGQKPLKLRHPRNLLVDRMLSITIRDNK